MTDFFVWWIMVLWKFKNECLKSKRSFFRAELASTINWTKKILFSIKTCVVGTQKNCLNQQALFGTKAHAQTGDQEDNYNLHSKRYLSWPMYIHNNKFTKFKIQNGWHRRQFTSICWHRGTDQPVCSHFILCHHLSHYLGLKTPAK